MTDQPITETFLAMLRPSDRTPRKITEDDEYLAMLWRMVRGLEARACGNAELLPQIIALTQRLSEVANVAIAANADRYAVNPHAAPSMAECARAMGISKQSASERRARGRQIIESRIAAAGAVKFAEAHRERAAMRAAAEHAATSLADYRARVA